MKANFWSTLTTLLQFIFFCFQCICFNCSFCRVVVISECHSDPEVLLTKMNSVLRRIDLFCKLCAPVLTGFIISFVSLKASALTLALWNSISIWLEYWLFISVYNGIPALGESSQRKISRPSRTDVEESTSTSDQERISLLSHDENGSQPAEESWIKRITEAVSRIPYVGAWKVYLQQDVVLPGVALALLFFTVLRSQPNFFFFFFFFLFLRLWLYILAVLTKLICYFQLWNIDDSYPRMARHTCICYRDSSWNKCCNWNCCYNCLSYLAISYFNTQNRALVYLVSGKKTSAYILEHQILFQVTFSNANPFSWELWTLTLVYGVYVVWICSGPSSSSVLLQFGSIIAFYQHICWWQEWLPLGLDCGCLI